VIKHFVPSDKFNKFIPLVNVLACTGLFASQGADWATAMVNGVFTALAASKTHDVATTGTALKNVTVKKWWAPAERQGL
jgi:hypothetical protein